MMLLETSFNILFLLYDEGEMPSKEIALRYKHSNIYLILSDLIAEKLIKMNKYNGDGNYVDLTEKGKSYVEKTKGYKKSQCTSPLYYETPQGNALFEVWDEWITEGYCIGGILAHAYRYAKKEGESKLSCAKNIRGLTEMLITYLEKEEEDIEWKL